MTADELVRYATQGPFFLIFILVAVEAVRRPLRAHIDIALFFGAIAGVLAVSWVESFTGAELTGQLDAMPIALLMAVPYLLLRLVNDFAGAPPWVLRLAEVGLALAIASVFILDTEDLPLLHAEVLVAYFVALTIYCTTRFVRETQTTGGVTRRRMLAAAGGSLFLGMALLFAGLNVALPAFLWDALVDVSVLLTGLSYAVAFTPPTILRRAWQEPELRRFLSQATELPRLPDVPSIAEALEAGARSSTGAPHASVILWDDQANQLAAPAVAEPDVPVMIEAPRSTIAQRAFDLQQPLFTDDASRDDPANANLYRDYDANSILAAPITAGERRLGVLAVYAPRAPIFAREDLELVGLLADQAAVIFESRTLIEEAAEVQAREEATRLKDDFLSAAAHDLKTPLTTLVGQAQLMQRRAQRRPDAPADPEGVARLVREAGRMRDLVNDLLDASRAEQGGLLGERELVDLATLAREVTSSQEHRNHSLAFECAAPVPVFVDRARMQQVMQNLIDNAVKYSPDGGDTSLALTVDGLDAHLAITDRGIGIAPEDVPHIFGRFWRSAGLNDRRFAGMGLGLFICHRIVEEHGGRIWVESTVGKGSTFHVALPMAENGERA